MTKIWMSCPVTLNTNIINNQPTSSIAATMYNSVLNTIALSPFGKVSVIICRLGFRPKVWLVFRKYQSVVVELFF
jgi:hypothetical protein